MKYLYYSPQEKSQYRYAILVKNIRKEEIYKAYLETSNINPNDVIVIDLHQTPGKKKTPAEDMKKYITEELQPVFLDLSVEYVLVADSDYFKTFSKSSKSDAMIGYVVGNTFGPQHIAYVPNYQAIFYDPDKVKEKIKFALDGVEAHAIGTYQPPGEKIIQFCAYPKTPDEIKVWLDQLLRWDRDYTCDIEAFSLKHPTAGIGTITFCWNQEEGISFPVDYGTTPEDALLIRKYLKSFFKRYRRKMIYHHIAFDVYILIYQLFMDDILDQAGLLEGLQIMLRNWDDTKLITYLATNSCAGNRLGLKEQAQEYAGNWGMEEIKDITKIPLPDLLQYNLVDGLSTWYVHNKYYDTMVADNQLDIYETIFKPAIVDIIQMQLTGMPVDMEEVKRIKPLLQADSDKAMARMNAVPLTQQFNYSRLEAYVEEKNSTWVKKRTTIAETQEAALTNEKIRDEITFNPNSGPQLQKLLFEMCNLPVIALTDSKQPATDADTLKALKNHTQDPDLIEFLDALVDFKAVDKILTTVIPALEGAVQGPDGWHYLFGNFNLGGTVSGRLSSSGPNLQNLPATGTKYAKWIKGCFKAPPGWFFCGIDFNSLEDRISALTTKDPQKLKVYTDGYDGHCLRAYAYFGDQMPDIDPNNVDSINSIADKYKGLRQDSKVPTFSLTYAGTYKTIMTSQGWSKEKAQKVEKSYHELYAVSDLWVKDKLDQASKDGYITAAFGLRVRTPLLHQVVRGNRKTPHEAEAEGRTAGNALGQSWCLLNSRAGTEFMTKVRASEFSHDIKPCAQIHDAQYYLIKDNIEAIMYANDNVVKACEWQNHPEIAHPDVKLGGTFSIFYPTWTNEMSIANNATAEEIYQTVQKHMDKLAA